MIALLISDLFLITFAFLNYACFHVDLVQPVGWRPTFKVGSTFEFFIRKNSMMGYKEI
jgi:solute carrier family 12 sodium/potassium/chloride transporter 2